MTRQEGHPGAEGVIDLRSDTVTLPTPTMLVKNGNETWKRKWAGITPSSRRARKTW